MSKVALITGGASGMGLAVAEALAKRGGWKIHLLDLNEERGQEAASALGQDAAFYKVDVTSYKSLASAFDKIFKSGGKLDFVFANAGIVERWNFYEKQDVTPPPEPDQLSIDVDLKSVVSTTYLALHYFRLSPSAKSGTQSLCMTASCGAFYPSPFSPMYTAAKHGVLGLTRAVAKAFYSYDKIRVNCICPGTVRTNLLDSGGWSVFPPEYFTPIEKITEVVTLLIDGENMTDAKGVQVKKGEVYGRAAEINGTNYYFRDMIEYCDDRMKIIMEATNPKEEGDRRFVK